MEFPAGNCSANYTRRPNLTNLNINESSNGSIEDNTQIPACTGPDNQPHPKDLEQRRRGRRLTLVDVIQRKELAYAKGKIAAKIDNRSLDANRDTQKKRLIDKDLIHFSHMASRSSQSSETFLKSPYAENGSSSETKTYSDVSDNSDDESTVPKRKEKVYAKYVQEGDRNLMLILEPKETKTEVYCKQIGNKNVIVHLNMSSNLCQLLDPINKGIIPLDNEGEVWLEIKRRSQVLASADRTSDRGNKSDTNSLSATTSDIVSCSDNCAVPGISETFVKQPYEHTDHSRNQFLIRGHRTPTENTETYSLSVDEYGSVGNYDILDIKESRNSLLIKCEKLDSNGALNWENLRESPILSHEKVLKFLEDEGNDFDVNICDWEYEKESVYADIAKIQIACVESDDEYEEIANVPEVAKTIQDGPYISTCLTEEKEALNNPVYSDVIPGVEILNNNGTSEDPKQSQISLEEADTSGTDHNNEYSEIIRPTSPEQRAKCRSKSDSDADFRPNHENKSRRLGFALSDSVIHSDFLRLDLIDHEIQFLKTAGSTGKVLACSNPCTAQRRKAIRLPTSDTNKKSHFPCRVRQEFAEIEKAPEVGPRDTTDTKESVERRIPTRSYGTGQTTPTSSARDFNRQAYCLHGECKTIDEWSHTPPPPAEFFDNPFNGSSTNIHDERQSSPNTQGLPTAPLVPPLPSTCRRVYPAPTSLHIADQTLVSSTCTSNANGQSQLKPPSPTHDVKLCGVTPIDENSVRRLPPATPCRHPQSPSTDVQIPPPLPARYRRQNKNHANEKAHTNTDPKLEKEFLQQYSWYHGTIDKSEAAQRLAGQNNGSFLVRNAIATVDPTHLYTIEILDGDTVKKMKIIKSDNRYHFHEFDTQVFCSMEELVETIVSTGIELKEEETGCWRTLLVKPIPRS